MTSSGTAVAYAIVQAGLKLKTPAGYNPMASLVAQTAHQLFSIITQFRRLGEEPVSVTLVVQLLPLPLGWPLAIWFAGGRGSAAASSFIITMYRSVSWAVRTHIGIRRLP